MGPAYEAIIGLECHAQLHTASKLFCGCPVTSDAPPNSAVCEVCVGHPGALPTLNDRAVKLGVRAALALGCTVHATSVFARKHYFYPDLPKGYQITQAERPLATGGAVHAGGRSFGVTRVHLEEDAGRMVHDAAGSVVDWNRAGVPLVEIVSAPDLRTPEDAELYLRTLHRVLVAGGICLGDLERGQLRADVNVSVHRPGAPWGTRVEVKNVNSFRFVAKAVRFEIERQVAVLEAGGAVERETRTWSGGRTVPLRKKEGAADYRYLDEPDLPPLRVSAEERAGEVAALPGVPLDVFLAEADAARARDWATRYGLPERDVAVLVAEPDVAAFFAEAVAEGGAPAAMAAWVRAEVMRRRRGEEGIGALAPRHFVAVQRMIDAGAINRDGAKKVLDLLFAAGGDAEALAEAHGLRQFSDEGALRTTIVDLLARFPVEVARYRAGNRGLIGFFMGHLMAATGRRADPKLADRLLREELDTPTETRGST